MIPLSFSNRSSSRECLSFVICIPDWLRAMSAYPSMCCKPICVKINVLFFMDLIPAIFFEKQEGQLCAQHALNNLLQGQYFTAVDLAEIARELDEEELKQSSEKDIKDQNQQGSCNYNETGFFSIQVIAKGLRMLTKISSSNLES